MIPLFGITPFFALIPILFGLAAFITIILLVNRFLNLYSERNQIFRKYVDNCKNQVNK